MQEITVIKKSPGSRLLNALLAVVLALGICIPTAALSASSAYAADTSASIKEITVGSEDTVMYFTPGQADTDGIVPVTAYVKPGMTAALSNITITFDNNAKQGGSYTFGNTYQNGAVQGTSKTLSGYKTSPIGLWYVNVPLYISVANSGKSAGTTTFKITFQDGTSQNSLTSVTVNDLTEKPATAGSNDPAAPTPVEFTLPSGTNLGSVTLTLEASVGAQIYYVNGTKGFTANGNKLPTGATQLASYNAATGNYSIEANYKTPDNSLYLLVVASDGTFANGYYQVVVKDQNPPAIDVNTITVGGQDVTDATKGKENGEIGTPIQITSAKTAWGIDLDDPQTVTFQVTGDMGANDVYYTQSTGKPVAANYEKYVTPVKSSASTDENPVYDVTIGNVTFGGSNTLYVALPNTAATTPTASPTNYMFYSFLPTGAADAASISNLVVGGVNATKDPTASTTEPNKSGDGSLESYNAVATDGSVAITFDVVPTNVTVQYVLAKDGNAAATAFENGTGLNNADVTDKGAVSTTITTEALGTQDPINNVYWRIAPNPQQEEPVYSYFAFKVEVQESSIDPSQVKVTAVVDNAAFTGEAQTITFTVSGGGATQWPTQTTTVNYTLTPVGNATVGSSSPWTVKPGNSGTATIDFEASSPLQPGQYTATVDFNGQQLGSGESDIYAGGPITVTTTAADSPETTSNVIDIPLIDLSNAKLTWSPENGTYNGEAQDAPSVQSAEIGEWTVEKKCLGDPVLNGGEPAIFAATYNVSVPAANGNGWVTGDAAGTWTVGQATKAPTLSLSPNGEAGLYLVPGQSSTFDVVLSNIYRAEDLAGFTVTLTAETYNDQYFTFSNPAVTDSATQIPTKNWVYDPENNTATATVTVTAGQEANGQTVKVTAAGTIATTEIAGSDPASTYAACYGSTITASEPTNALTITGVEKTKQAKITNVNGNQITGYGENQTKIPDIIFPSNSATLSNVSVTTENAATENPLSCTFEPANVLSYQQGGSGNDRTLAFTRIGSAEAQTVKVTLNCAGNATGRYAPAEPVTFNIVVPAFLQAGIETFAGEAIAFNEEGSQGSVNYTIDSTVNANDTQNVTVKTTGAAAGSSLAAQVTYPVVSQPISVEQPTQGEDGTFTLPITRTSASAATATIALTLTAADGYAAAAPVTVNVTLDAYEPTQEVTLSASNMTLEAEAQANLVVTSDLVASENPGFKGTLSLTQTSEGQSVVTLGDAIQGVDEDGFIIWTVPVTAGQTAGTTQYTIALQAEGFEAKPIPWEVTVDAETAVPSILSVTPETQEFGYNGAEGAYTFSPESAEFTITTQNISEPSGITVTGGNDVVTTDVTGGNDTYTLTVTPQTGATSVPSTLELTVAATGAPEGSKSQTITLTFTALKCNRSIIRV